MRRFENNGWIVGAVLGAGVGAWLGYRLWHYSAPRGTSPSSAMIIVGLIGAGVGSVIGGVLNSK